MHVFGGGRAHRKNPVGLRVAACMRRGWAGVRAGTPDPRWAEGCCMHAPGVRAAAATTAGAAAHHEPVGLRVFVACAGGARSDSDDGGGAQQPPPDEAELEEDEFEAMFKGAKSRRRRRLGDEVRRQGW